jgi:hypothetical protein
MQVVIPRKERAPFPLFVTDAEVEALSTACRVLVAISTRSRCRRDALRLILHRLPAARRLELVSILRELTRAADGDNDLYPATAYAPSGGIRDHSLTAQSVDHRAEPLY